MSRPAIVVSLDFERRWGVAEKLPDDSRAYGRHLDGETDAVLGLLDFFERTGVGATWATVGALACSGWEEYHARAPARELNVGFRPEWQLLDPAGALHFAPDLVEAITRTTGQELASHTFSHMYFREPAVGREAVLADSRAVARLFRDRTGRPPTSFVFPRNQVARTDLLKSVGIERWRTNPKTSYWNATRSDEQSQLVRGMRLLDAALPLGTRLAPKIECRASYFVRFSLPASLWKAHVRRIVRDARRLTADKSLHLWWHPHNLGADVPEGLRRVKELFERLRSASPGGTEFVSMEQSFAAG